MDDDYFSFFEKFICIELVNGKCLKGECFTIDPITKSIVIVVQNNDVEMFSIEVVMQHAVKSINREEDLSKDNTLFTTFKKSLCSKLFGGKDKFDKELLLKRKQTLLCWFKKNQLPVELTDSDTFSVVHGVAMIEPPYTVECCRSTNTIILDKVMKIIKACPGLD